MAFLKFLISLVSIIDPIFAAILVATLVTSAKEIKKIAFKSSLTVLIASIITIIAGDTLLKLLGVNIYSVKIFGGLILLHMAFQMLQAHPPKMKHTDREESATTEKDDISVIPIGIPILFGPGAFTTLLIFKEEVHSLSGLFQLFLAVVISVLIIYLFILNSAWFSRRLGKTGIGVTVRIFGLFVGALGSQFIVDGIKHLWIQG